MCLDLHSVIKTLFIVVNVAFGCASSGELVFPADAFGWNYNFMPPEPLPWDRKDFFKERKHNNNNSHHDRTASDSLLGGGGGPLTRWKDYSSFSSHSRELPRWGSVDSRRPTGIVSVLIAHFHLL